MSESMIPVTPEWLVTLGGERYAAAPRIGPHVEFLDDDRLLEVGDNGRVWYSRPAFGDRVWLTDAGTRGQFLALLAGLKWPAKGVA